MKSVWMAVGLVLIGCSSTTHSDGSITRHEYTGSMSRGMSCEDVLYARGQPARIEYPGPNIEEWIYVAEKMPPQRDDTIVPNPFPRDVANVQTTRTIYRFEHRTLQQVIELQPGEVRKK